MKRVEKILLQDLGGAGELGKCADLSIWVGKVDIWPIESMLTLYSEELPPFVCALFAPLLPYVGSSVVCMLVVCWLLFWSPGCFV